jgi:DNA invertase Pin-like site-specific DNA recombinase
MRKAIGIIRISRTKGEGIVSPTEQRERIEAACSRDGLELLDVLDEYDVSGGAVLEKRPGLRRAVAMVEAGDADTIVVAYFDRLVRSIVVQAEVVSRVEAAGGGILAVDVGRVTNGSSAQWLSGNVLGLVAEYQRRMTAERTEDAKRRAIADGVPTFSQIPPGYLRPRDANGNLIRTSLVLDPDSAPAMRDVWQMRAGGATIAECRAFLSQRGFEVGYSQLTGIFGNRIYLGELRFGEYVNPTAHEPLIDRATFERVQRVSVPRGRKPKSDRLLARLGVLRCSTCGARLVVGTTRANGRDYPMYRCPPNGDCPQRVTISAEVVENVVIEATRHLLRGIEGTAAIDDGIAEAEREVGRTEAELDAAVRAFTGLDDVPAAQERLLALREARDHARDHLDEMRSVTVPAVTVTAEDWDTLTVDERRDLIVAVVDKASVRPGRGEGRVTVEPRFQ